MPNKVARSMIGVALALLVGFSLWKSPLGAPLVNYSYDGLCLFPSRSVTNKVTVITMDNQAFDALHQKRGAQWDRRLHAQLLDKLAVDNCAVVVLDLYLSKGSEREKEQDLARAMKRHHEIALRAGAANVTETNLSGIRPLLPFKRFLNAAGENWGISHFAPDQDGIVRRHWPFPSPGKFPSLAEAAARTAGAVISESPHQRWLRYYGQPGPWMHISYDQALKETPMFFHGQIVFIGVEPRASAPVNAAHKFRTPYSHWTGQAAAGTDVLATEFLNLLNRESLRRWYQMDMFVLLICGLAIGAVLPRLRFAYACFGALAAALVVVAFAVNLTATTNYWFPWLLVVGGQLPVVLVWSFVNHPANKADHIASKNKSNRADRPPNIPGYRLAERPFGHGAYGEVWLGQNQSCDWRAIKIISADRFDSDPGPYEREYEGVSRYRHVCDKHPGLLRVEFVSEKSPAQFYYVMELGDALEPGWEDQPTTYKPRDLNLVRSLAPQKRIPLEECLRIGLALTETLDFLHRSGFTHRDIKPQNILFVKGQPKLADLGLITNVRTIDSERTAVGTPGYMPPLPEMPGTPQADIYALGMVLYVISTGRSPVLFPELSATLLGEKDPTEFFLLNSIVLKACQLDPKDRYASAREMYDALEQLKSQLAV